MELKGRLGAIAERIPPCGVLADIGTDHAYIPVYAVMKGLCRKAVAADVRPGPVRIAERNIRRFRLDDRIEARLGGGLEPLAAKEADVTVIAGMGGPLICEILDKSVEKAKDMKLLILQPMNFIEAVRKWLNDAGFAIREEVLAKEGKKLYHVICACWTGTYKSQDEYELYTGKELMQSRDPLLGEYLKRKLGQLDVIIAGKEKSGIPDSGLDMIKATRARLAEDMDRICTERRAGTHL